MRPQVVVTVLGLALACLGLLAVFTRKPATPLQPPVSSGKIATANDGGNEPSRASLPTSLAAPALARIEPVPNHAEYVNQRISELQTLQLNNDANSLKAILSELPNPDRAIRDAAREAAVQFGDRSAIPILKDLADQTDDPTEKSELLAAAEYLALPTLAEHQATRSASRTQPLGSTSTNRVRRPRL
jgi:hypothetical protein